MPNPTGSWWEGGLSPPWFLEFLAPKLGACGSVTKISLASISLVSTSETPSASGVRFAWYHDDVRLQIPLPPKKVKPIECH